MVEDLEEDLNIFHFLKTCKVRIGYTGKSNMSKKLYVGGLSWGTNNDGLKAAFANCGTVEDARVIFDRESGRSRGFGFVTYADEASAQNALKEWDGKELDGRTLKVSIAQERAQKPGGRDQRY